MMSKLKRIQAATQVVAIDNLKKHKKKYPLMSSAVPKWTNEKMKSKMMIIEGWWLMKRVMTDETEIIL